MCSEQQQRESSVPRMVWDHSLHRTSQQKAITIVALVLTIVVIKSNVLLTHSQLNMFLKSLNKSEVQGKALK